MTETSEVNTAAKPLVSIVIPIYNEAATICQVIEWVREALADLSYEIVLVDDGSTDGTAVGVQASACCEDIGGIQALACGDAEEEELQSKLKLEFQREDRLKPELQPDRLKPGLQLLLHATNQGKGAALRTGFAACRGEIVVVQDADLEYVPRDIPRLIQPIIDGRADVVIGSRFHGEAQRVHLFWHRAGNALLTLFSNLFTNLNLSDMECGYKAFRREVLQGITIEENRFGVEPELVAKVARGGWRVFEVPVSYAGRDYAEGKKIGFKDALRAVWCIIRYHWGD